VATTAVKHYQMFVGGQWTDAANGETQPVVNPATGEVMAEVPKGTEADVERAVAAARRAFEGWVDTTPRERSEMLLKLADGLIAHGAVSYTHLTLPTKA